MNIANLSPAERMKAFGLVGLIIVALFFTVHTLLGAVAPKKTQTPNPTNSAAAPGVPGPPAPGGAPVAALEGPATVEEAFPIEKATATARKSSDSEREVPDPFVQIREPEQKGKFGQVARRYEEPVMVQPTESPNGSRLGGLPAYGSVAPFGASAPATITVAPVEPEIKVIGLVHGDAPVATLSVAGRIQIARPGDAIAKGYRLMQVTTEGVLVRHKGEYNSLRVGTAMNTPAPKS